MPDEFASLLRQLLHDPDALARRAALRELMERHAAHVQADLLLQVFQTDPDPLVRDLALSSLAAFGERAPLVPLVRIIREQPENADFRWRAIEVLGHLGRWTPIDLLQAIAQDQSEEAVVREYAWQALVTQRNRVPFQLFEDALRDGEPAVRAAVVQAAAEGDLEVAPRLLIERLSDPDGFVRQKALRALRRLPVETSIEPVAALLDDPEPQVRNEAALAMERLLDIFGPTVPLDGLLRLAGDAVFYVRETALDVFGQHPDYVPAHLFVQALKDENSLVRVAAASGLKNIAARLSPEFRPALEEAQDDPDDLVRQDITFVLMVLDGLADPDHPPQHPIEWVTIG